MKLAQPFALVPLTVTMCVMPQISLILQGIPLGSPSGEENELVLCRIERGSCERADVAKERAMANAGSED